MREVFLIISIALIFVLGIFQTVNFISAGQEVSSGILIEHKVGVINCVRISQTSIGDSRTAKYCSFFEIENVPSIKSNIDVVYFQSKVLGFNTVKVTPSNK